MSFKRKKGSKGMFYVPEENLNIKKHICKDCYYCQFCSDERCALCLGEKSKCHIKCGGECEGEVT